MRIPAQKKKIADQVLYTAIIGFWAFFLKINNIIADKMVELTKKAMKTNESQNQ